MEHSHALLLDVWREACRHIEIHESTATIAGMLPPRLPLDRILVQRIDLRRSSLETVACGSPAGSGRFDPARIPCTSAQLERLLAWCARGETLFYASGHALDPDLAFLVPQDLEGDVVAGPLRSPHGPAGVLIVAAPPETPFDARHREMVRALLEPFSAALENDHRLRELAALQETAEAERRSLLARLGRKTLEDPIVGAEAGLRPVMERVALVSRSDVPVLILGETGTGKELVARAIHQRSARADGPFMRANCGAIPPELIDSELFGHERGSFTGAVELRKGWFERADGGTLFLDEVGELPQAAQVRLLRILQDGCLERVGGQREIRVDVRIVAATNRELRAMVDAGAFREDLWYRIAVLPIGLPPLRERAEDIPALACHFAQKAANRFGLPLVMPSPDDLRRLVVYPWPGNVRELAAVIDRAAILGNGRRLEVAKALGLSSTDARPASAAPPPPARTAARIESLDAAMKAHIERALAATEGRIEGPHGAAALLGINPHTLRARMRKLAIDWRRFRKVSET